MINEGRDLKVGENYCQSFKNADETCGVSNNWWEEVLSEKLQKKFTKVLLVLIVDKIFREVKEEWTFI